MDFYFNNGSGLESGFAITRIHHQTGAIIDQELVLPTYAPQTGILLAGLEVLDSEYVVLYEAHFAPGVDTTSLRLRYTRKDNSSVSRVLHLPTAPFIQGDEYFGALKATPSGLACMVSQYNPQSGPAKRYILHMDSAGTTVQWTTIPDDVLLHADVHGQQFGLERWPRSGTRQVSFINHLGVTGNTSVLPTLFTIGKLAFTGITSDNAFLGILYTEFILDSCKFVLIDQSATVQWQIPIQEILPWIQVAQELTRGGYVLAVTNALNNEIKIRVYSSVVSVPQNRVMPIRLYPNPAQDIVSVESQTAGRIALYSIAGQQVLEQELQEGHTQLSVQSLRPGIYVYHCHSATAYHTGRIVVSR